MKKNYSSRTDLLLRKVGRQYMIVETCDGVTNLTNVFSLNESAAFLWQLMAASDQTAEQLAAGLAAIYQLTMSDVLADVERQLAEWQDFGLLKEG